MTLKSARVTSTEETSTKSTIESITTTDIPQNLDLNIKNELDSSSSTNSDNNQQSSNDNINIKHDPETQIQIEKNLLTLFGMSKRPKPIDRSKIVIPEAMKMLYAEMMGEELRESVNLPKPGFHTKSANTVRSFTHEGKYRFASFPLEYLFID